MLKEPTINNLFPTPIYMTNIDREFTKKELNFVKDQKNHCSNNEGSISTIDNYILNRPEFKKIKKFIEDCCQDYLEKIICPKNDIKLYVTQSWLNYIEEKQYLHKHEHPNSIVSGVLWLNSDKKNDNIHFYDGKGYQQICPLIEDTKFNTWNSPSWWFAVETGQLAMFPSSTTHQVKTKKGNNTRVSLAFNTFYKGIVGSNKELTELIL
jgi:uncharacterized protein (TIGR02466 family)